MKQNYESISFAPSEIVNKKEEICSNLSLHEKIFGERMLFALYNNLNEPNTLYTFSSFANVLLAEAMQIWKL
jgi:hypothetical protein